MRKLLICIALLLALTACAAAEEIRLPLEVVVEESLGEYEGKTYTIEEERYTLPCELSVFLENDWWLYNENYHMFEEYFFNYHSYGEDGISFERYLEVCEEEGKYSDAYIQLLHDQFYGGEYESELEKFNEFYFKYELEEWDDAFYEQLLEGFEAYYARKIDDVFWENYWLDDESRMMSAEELSDEENVYILRRNGDEDVMLITLRSENGEDCALGNCLVTGVSVGSMDDIFEPYQDWWAPIECAGVKYGVTAWDTLPDSVEADAGFAWFEGEEEASGRTYMLSASLMGEGETVSELSISVE